MLAFQREKNKMMHRFAFPLPLFFSVNKICANCSQPSTMQSILLLCAAAVEYAFLEQIKNIYIDITVVEVKAAS